MVNEETIYTGNTQFGSADNNEGVLKDIVQKAWKPVSIGGATGIILGAGAILTRHTVAVSHEQPVAASEHHEVSPTNAVPAAQGQDAPAEFSGELRVVSVSDELAFNEAFAEARAQVGPGGVFHWHGVVFSTYTAEEWESMSEEQQNQYAMQVRPEVDATQVDAEAIAEQPVEEQDVQDDMLAEDVAVAEDAQGLDVQDVAIADDLADIPAVEANEEFILADVHEAEGGFALDDDIELDEDVAIADNNVDVVEDIALAEEDLLDEDVVIAENEDAFALDEMFSLESGDDVAIANAKSTADAAAISDSFKNFPADDVVRIVGYGEFDGHTVRGLDLNGDGMADVAVIDVDDSGDLSRADVVVEDGSGNMSTYGEFHDMAMDQFDDDHDGMHDNIPNPDVAEDMPDYMDDAIAQL